MAGLAAIYGFIDSVTERNQRAGDRNFTHIDAPNCKITRPENQRDWGPRCQVGTLEIATSAEPLKKQITIIEVYNRDCQKLVEMISEMAPNERDALAARIKLEEFSISTTELSEFAQTIGVNSTTQKVKEFFQAAFNKQEAVRLAKRESEEQLFDAKAVIPYSASNSQALLRIFKDPQNPRHADLKKTLKEIAAKEKCYNEQNDSDLDPYFYRKISRELGYVYMACNIKRAALSEPDRLPEAHDEALNLIADCESRLPPSQSSGDFTKDYIRKMYLFGLFPKIAQEEAKA